MIRKDDILRMTEKGVSVFRYYLPVDFKVGKNFLNPFYKDTKASCNIYYERKAGVFKMKDFGNEDYSGDCFELVGRLNGLSCKEPKEFVEIMEIINRDLHLGLSSHEEYHVSHSKVPQKNEVVSEEPKMKSVRPYTVVQKPFTAAELAFWGKSGIGENVLKEFRPRCPLRQRGCERNCTVAGRSKHGICGRRKQWKYRSKSLIRRPRGCLLLRRFVILLEYDLSADF